MTATLPSCTAPISLCESDSTFMRFKPPSSFSGSPSLGSNVGRTPSYDPLAYRVSDIPRFDTPIGGGSSSLRSEIRGSFDFSKIDLSSLGISRGGSPSLDSRIEKIDFGKIDFSSLGKPKEESPSWDSSTFSYKPFAIPRFDSPPDFGGSSSLRSGIGSRDYSTQFNYLDTLKNNKVHNPINFLDGIGLTSTQKKIQISETDTNRPLTRLDFADYHKPYNHIQYGGSFGFDPKRNGEEADNLLSHIILKKLGINL